MENGKKISSPAKVVCGHADAKSFDSRNILNTETPEFVRCLRLCLDRELFDRFSSIRYQTQHLIISNTTTDHFRLDENSIAYNVNDLMKYCAYLSSLDSDVRLRRLDIVTDLRKYWKHHYKPDYYEEGWIRYEEGWSCLERYRIIFLIYF